MCLRSSLNAWIRWRLPGVFAVKSPSSLPLLHSLGWVTKPVLPSGEGWGRGKLHLLEGLLHMMLSGVRKICLFSTFTCLFNYLFIPVWAHAYLLYILDYNSIIQYIISFVVQIFPSLATGSPFTWYLCPLDNPLPFVFLNILLFDIMRYSRLILSFLWSTLESALVPLVGEWYLETKTWVLGVLSGTGVSLPPALLVKTAG